MTSAGKTEHPAQTEITGKKFCQWASLLTKNTMPLGRMMRLQRRNIAVERSLVHYLVNTSVSTVVEVVLEDSIKEEVVLGDSTKVEAVLEDSTKVEVVLVDSTKVEAVLVDSTKVEVDLAMEVIEKT